MTGRVRQFTGHDVPRVARLHEKVFPGADVRTDADYAAYFTDVFLENPAGTGRLGSLVYENDEGQIEGFLGVVPRTVVLGCCRYEAAVSSQFMVDASPRLAVIAVTLVKAYLEGPQDLSIADEATAAARNVWERLGGSTALLNSLYWTRALRPARLALSFARQRPSPNPLAMAAVPLGSAVDAFAAHLPGSRFRQRDAALQAEELTPRTALTYAPELFRGSLWIEYDERTFQWLLNRAATRSGRLITAAFRDGLDIVGWYICHLDNRGQGQVVHLAATAASIERVLDHLFHQAWQHGAISLTGRLDPRFMQALSDRHCLFHRRGPWVLIKSTNPELLSSLHMGSAAISPLDGEWSLRFFPVQTMRRAS
jgi:hypothetical protein